MPINRISYPVNLDTKSVTKSTTIVRTQVAESIILDLTLTDEDYTIKKNIENMKINFSCLLNDENNNVIFYKQYHEDCEDGKPLTTIVDATNGKVRIYLKKDFANCISQGLAEIHIINENGEMTITNRFKIEILKSYTNEVPTELLVSGITVDKLQEIMDNYLSVLDFINMVTETNQLNHVHTNYIILNKLSEKDGELYYDGEPIKIGNEDLNLENYYDINAIDELLQNINNNLDTKFDDVILEDTKLIFKGNGIELKNIELPNGSKGGGYYIGTSPPTDTSLLWIDTSESTIDTTITSLIMEEFRNVVSQLNNRIIKLEEDVLYLKLNGTGNSGDSSGDNIILLEDGNYLVTESDDCITLERSVS